MKVTHDIYMPYMDVLAALRIAAIQARRDRMPITAKRHEQQANELEAAYDGCDNLHIILKGH